MVVRSDWLARRAEALSESQFERVTRNAARLAMVVIGVIAVFAVLKIGQVVLAPVWVAVVLGLVFGPVADLFERRGIAPALSAAMVVILFIALILGGMALFAVPLSDWIGQLPTIWLKIRVQLASLSGIFDSLGSIETQLSSAFGGGSGVPVRLQSGSPVFDIARLAPEIGAQILLFLASLYFFLATRESFRISLLSLCVTRRMRWRTAHIFSDVEGKVSRFVIVVSILNAGVGIAVAFLSLALGLPSPLLWGALAAVLNYIPYIGQAVMIIILVSVGLGSQPDLMHALLPVGGYLVITLLEGQFITPHFLGRTMTINPFLILLATTLSIWLWGPLGGLVSVPSLLIVQSVLSHVLPSKPVQPRRPVVRTAGMTEREEILANAARAIKEKAQEKAAEEAAAKGAGEASPPTVRPA